MTKFVCLTGIRTGNPVAVNPDHVVCVFLSDVWYNDGNEYKEPCVELKMAQKYSIQVKESHEEVLKAFEEAGVQIRKAKSNG